MPRLRVFISYAREDDALAARAEDALRARGLEPLRDRNIRPGRDFRSEIGELIARAHIFMPIITEVAQARAWVHQETGFAVALGIPVLPIAAKTLPGEMIASVQTLSVNSDFSDLEQRIQQQDFDRVMEEAIIPPYSLVDVVYWPEERIRKLTFHTQRVMQFPEFDRLRQKAPMSSFSIPDADVQDSVWSSREEILRDQSITTTCREMNDGRWSDLRD
jgi:TIR domain